MSKSPVLLHIAALARAGAADHAWEVFQASGLAASAAPADLSLKGRLLKELGRRAEGDERRKFYHRSAEAYRLAAQRGGGAYPLINAATLSLLAGDEASARLHALAALDAPEEQHETPYYQVATRAEALLVLRRSPEARDALAQAVSLAPEAWEDHAITLRQFALVLETLGEDAEWLNVFRPPRTLHFAGLIGLSPHDEALAQAVARVVAEEKVGFGYGALAAGADIVIAEALAAAGAELHVVLPVDPVAFRARSVQPYGEAWASRFDALMKTVGDRVSVVAPGCGPADPAALRLAAETAMGLAVMKAAALATEPLQLLILEGGDLATAPPGLSVQAGQLWAACHRRQRSLSASRVSTVGGRMHAGATTRLAAFLCVEFEIDIGASDPDGLLRHVAGLLPEDAAGLAPPVWLGRTLWLAYGDLEAASRASRAILSAGGDGVRLAGHYGLAVATRNPFGPGAILLGPEVERARSILPSVPPGAMHGSLCFAAALVASGAAVSTERVGDLTSADGAMGLYALGFS